MLKAIYVGSGLKIIGEFVPSTRHYAQELCIGNFDLQKGNFNFLLQQHVATLLLLTGQKTSLTGQKTSL